MDGQKWPPPWMMGSEQKYHLELLYSLMQWNLLYLICSLDFLVFFCVLRLIYSCLLHAALWYQYTRVSAAAILSPALIFPLWRLQVPPSDAFLIAFSLSQCICEPPLWTRELISSSDTVVGFPNNCSSVSVWVCEPGWSFSSPLMMLLHPKDGEEPGENMSVWKDGAMDDHCEAKLRCVVQPKAFPASWYLKACEQQLETSQWH